MYDDIDMPTTSLPNDLTHEDFKTRMVKICKRPFTNADFNLKVAGMKETLKGYIKHFSFHLKRMGKRENKYS